MADCYRFVVKKTFTLEHILLCKPVPANSTLLSAVNEYTQQTQTYKMKVRSGIPPSR